MSKLLCAVTIGIYGYTCLTKFERIIHVASKQTCSNIFGSLVTIITDENGNKYKITTSPQLLVFDSAKLNHIIQSKQSYKITGYGVELSDVGLYPNIIDAVSPIDAVMPHQNMIL